MSSKEENFKLFCELRGQEVEYKVTSYACWRKATLCEWYDNQVYCFGFQETDILTDEIRPIKKPEYKPWTAETIPFPLLVRGTAWANNQYAMILNIYHDSVCYRYNGVYSQISFDELLKDFETRDGKPCGEEVGDE